MKTLKMMIMPKGEQFKNAITQCKGNVYLRLPDDTVCDLKKDNAVISVLSAVAPRRVNMQLLYEEADDTASLLGMLF